MKVESVPASNVQQAHTNSGANKIEQIMTTAKALEEDTVTLTTQNIDDVVVTNGSGVGGGALPPK